MIKEFESYIKEKIKNPFKRNWVLKAYPPAFPSNSIDPYGEEDWDDKKLFKKRDHIICIDDEPSEIDGPVIYDNIKYLVKGKEYVVYDKWKQVMYGDSVPEGFLYFYKTPYWWSPDRFEPVNINENINSDIDPYGEEDDWGFIKFHVGDTVICKIDPITRNYFERDRKYKVTEVSNIDNEEVIRLENQAGGWWRAFRFKKVDINESINSDIDPWGEEDWNDKIDDFKIGDEVIYTGNSPLIFKLHFNKNGDKLIIKDIWDLNAHKKYINIGDEFFDSKDFKKVNNVLENHDLDPYDEEDWYEPLPLQQIQRGDDLICIYSRPGFYEGKKYKATYVCDKFILVKNKDGLNIPFFIDPNLSVVNNNFIKYFKKVNNVLENLNSDIDPYNEEDWDDNQLKNGDILHYGDIVICNDNIGVEDKLSLNVDYEVIDSVHSHITLKGIGGWFPKRRFVKYDD